MQGGYSARDVSVVTVCYNSAAVLPGMLESLPEGTQAIIVDNASADVEDTARIAARHGAHLIRNRANLGFGPACNRGAQAADTPFLLFLNPDARLQEGALAALLAAARDYPDAVAFNPRLSGASGKPQFKRRSKLLPRRQWLARGRPASDCEVPVLSGAAFFVRRADFDAVGGFDPAIFLYHEDDDLSLRLRAERGRLMFIHAASVTHLEGRSNERTPRSAAFKAEQLARSAVHAKRKHQRPWPFLSTLAEALAKILFLPNLLSARKRAQAAGFLKGTLAMRRRSGGG